MKKYTLVRRLDINDLEVAVNNILTSDPSVELVGGVIVGGSPGGAMYFIQTLLGDVPEPKATKAKK